MAIHDWARVSPGTWHDFHIGWVVLIQRTFNEGLLPPEYYAQVEQFAGPLDPDEGEPTAVVDDASFGQPRPPVMFSSEVMGYTARRRTIVIRHTSGDRIVALLEIVSPGNKSGQRAINSFVEKAQEALFRGYHLLIIDLFPPGPRDPNGIHAAIWDGFSAEPFGQPPGEPLTLVAYSAGEPKRAYIEPTAVGRELIDMPLFLTPDSYVNVPLEQTYQGAFHGVPRKWKAVLEGPASGEPGA